MSGAKAERRAAGLAFAGLSLAMLLAALGTSMVNIALPALAQAFGARFETVQWVVLAYLLAVTALIVSAGRLGDLLGRRRLLAGGLALFTLAALAGAAAPTLPLLIAARAVQGLGAAVMLSLSLACASQLAGGRTGSALGLLGAMSAAGTALGPALGGLVIAAAGWRAILLLNAPLGLLAIILILRYLPADPGPAPALPRHFDALGTLLLAAALAAYTLALAAVHGRLGLRNLALLAACLLLCAGYAWHERRATSPLLRLADLAAPRLQAGLALSLLVSTVLMATLVVGPFYLAQCLGLGPALAGLVMSAGPLAVALAGVPAGRMVDRFGARCLTRIGLGGIALGAGLLALLPASTGIPGYMAPLIVLTLGYALFQTANNTAVLQHASAAERGFTSSLLNLSRNLGLITGTALMGAVCSYAAGGGDLAAAAPAAVAHGMRTTFGVAVLLTAAALLLATRGAGRIGGSCRARLAQPAQS